MKITVTEKAPQPQERPYPKFRRSKGLVVFFTSETTGIVVKDDNKIDEKFEIGHYSNLWATKLFTDCDQDGNDLPPFEAPDPLPFPKVMKSHDSGNIVLFSSEKKGTILQIGDENFGWNPAAFSEYFDMSNFTDFHGTITIEQP